MAGYNTTFALALLVLLAAIGCCALPASADDLAADAGEVSAWSAWSAFRESVADLWSAGLGYNLRGREQQVGLEDEEDQDTGARLYSTRQHAGENGGGVCDPEATTVCSGHGWCTDDVCVCKKGWTGYQCGHERKSKKIAFLLEFFIGSTTGASSFYLGYTGQGVGKILMTWVGCILTCVAPGLTAVGRGKVKHLGIVGGLLGILAILSVIAVNIWCLVDWIMILTDDLNDSDGYYLDSSDFGDGA